MATDFDLQQQFIEQRRRQYAAQRDFQAPQGQMVGRHYVAPNALQYLAAGLRSIGGIRGQDLAEEELAQLSQRRTEGTQKALADFLRQSQGRPQEVLPDDVYGPARPAQAPDLRGAYSALLQAPDASLRQVGIQGIAQIPEQQARAADRQAELEFRKQSAEAQRQQRMQEIQLQHQQRMEYLQQNNADRAAMAAEQRAFQESQRQLDREFKSAITGAVGAQKAPAGYRFKEDGTLEAIPGGPASGKDGQKPLTEGQAKGTLFLGQMRSASTELDKLPKVSPVQTAMTGSTYANWAASPNAQKVAQLQNQWAEAYLRAKTGAAATQGEVDLNRRTFFPVVGDSPQVIEQKKAMRKQAERDMEAAAGPGAATAGGASSSWGDQTPSGNQQMPKGFRVVR